MKRKGGTHPPVINDFYDGGQLAGVRPEGEEDDAAELDLAPCGGLDGGLAAGHLACRLGLLLMEPCRASTRRSGCGFGRP